MYAHLNERLLKSYTTADIIYIVEKFLWLNQQLAAPIYYPVRLFVHPLVLHGFSQHLCEIANLKEFNNVTNGDMVRIHGVVGVRTQNCSLFQNALFVKSVICVVRFTYNFMECTRNAFVSQVVLDIT